MISQGHFVFHFVFWVTLQFKMVTEDKGPFVMLTQSEDVNTDFTVEALENSPVNCLLGHLKKMHLICFLLLFVANVVPSGSGNKVNLNWKLVKALMSFITIPYYLWQICDAFATLDKQFITYSDESSPEDFTVTDKIWVS